MPFTTPYASRSGTIGELLRRRGEIAGDAWARVGETVAGTIGSILREREQAPIRAREAEMAELQLGDARAASEARETGSRQDAALLALFDRDTPPDPREIIRVVGPQKGLAITQGLAALDELSTKKVKDARDTAGRLAIGVKALSPALQAQFWPQIRQAAIAGGLGDEQSIPAEANSEYLNGVIAWASGQPEKRGLHNVPEGSVVLDEANPQAGPVYRSPAAPKSEELVQVEEHGRPVWRPRSQAAGRPAYRAPSADNGEPLVAVMGDDGQPVMLPRSQAVGRRPASTREQGRPVTSGDAGRIADLDTSLDDLNVLARDIGVTGAQSAIEAKWVPDWATDLTGWGADAKARQAVIDRVKQVIGKALEGGVLRKEDEIKYERILPKIGDTPPVAKSKLKGLWEAIEKRRQTTIDALKDANYDVSRFESRAPRERLDNGVSGVPDLTGLQPGRGRKFRDGPFKGQTWSVDANGKPYKVDG